MKKILLLIIALLLSLPSYVSAGFDNGLKGYWPFNYRDSVWTSSAAGFTWDRSGNNYIGTYTNMAKATSFVTGKLEKGLFFDGTDDVVKLPTTAAVSGGDLTIALWFKTTRATRQEFYGEGNTTTGTPFFDVNITGSSCSTGQIGFGTRDNGGNLSLACLGPVAMNDGNWHHAVFELSGTSPSKVKTLYLDGSLSATATGITFNAMTTDSVVIGALQTGSATYLLPFLGTMDDVHTWTRALSAAEVKQLYRSGNRNKASNTDQLLDPIGI